MSNVLFGRKVSLILIQGQKAIDLSDFHIKFKVEQADFESPNNAYIRVYNLSEKTATDVQEFQTVVLQAGYESNFGVIFKGQVKQFGKGRENAKDTYLDIMAADGDEAYNFGVVNASLERGVTQNQHLEEAAKQMGIDLGHHPGDPGMYFPRGKVFFAMGRDVIRSYANTNKCSWSIQNGAIQIIPLDSYKPSDEVVVNAASGLIGQPVQNQNGITFKQLLNPALVVGQVVRINNADINQVIQAKGNPFPIPYNRRYDKSELPKVTADGRYRMLVIEHEGDTRGQSWYSEVVALAIDNSDKVNPYG